MKRDLGRLREEIGGEIRWKGEKQQQENEDKGEKVTERDRNIRRETAIFNSFSFIPSNVGCGFNI